MRRAILTAFRVLGLAAASALFIAWQLAPVPVVVKVVPAVLVVLTLLRPSVGLLIMAGLGPVIAAWAVRLASPYGATHAFEQLVLAVLLGAGPRLWRPVPLRLAEPALLMALVAIASAIAVQPVLLMHQVPGASAVEHIRILLSGAYFDRGMSGEPITFAVMTAEGLALAVVAERLVRDDAALAPQVVRMLVLGHAGLALASIDRLIGAALRTDTVLASIVRLLRTVRVSTYADLNAAGSAFAMVFAAGLGLLLDSSQWRRLTSFALALIAVGLWLAGSRTSLLALGIVLLGLLIVEAIQRRGRTRWIAVGATVAAISIGLLGAVSYPAIRNTSMSSALAVREFLTQIGVDMWRSAPVLGVGIGRFWTESARFGGAARLYGVVNENAHNNFLQVLAEQGIVGAFALALTLGTLFAGALRPSILQSPFKRFLAMGVVIFVLTWLGGHPLLLAEAGFAFWLLAGVLAGVTTPPGLSGWRTVVALGAVAMLFIGPVRADRAIRDEGFEYIGVGVSGWRPELEGVRYREASAKFQLYLPSDGTAVTLPLRRAPNAPDPLVITTRVGAEQLDEVRLTGNAWLEVPIQLPTANRKFELVEFTVTGADASSGSTLVFVGKTVVRSR